MKNSIWTRINYLSALLFAFMIFLPDKYMIIGFDLFVLTWIIERFSNRKYIIPKINLVVVLFFLLFFISIVSIFYSKNSNAAIDLVVRRIPILVFPLLIIFGINDSITYRNVSRYYVYGVFTGIITIIVLGIYKFYDSQQYMAEILTNPSTTILTEVQSFKHRIYFAVNICFAIIILLHRISICDLVKRKIVYSLLILSLTIILYVVESRGAMVSVLFIILSFILFNSGKNATKWMKLSFYGFVIVLALSLFLSPRFLPVKQVFTQSAKESMVQNPRLAIWQSSLSQIKQHVFIGVGCGDASSLVNNALFELGYEKARYEKFNSHNQFLEYWLESGILSFILLLGIVFFPVLENNRDKKFLVFAAIFLWFSTFMYESYLNRAAGIILFVFSYLLIYKLPVLCKSDDLKPFKSYEYILPAIMMGVSIGLLILFSGFFSYSPLNAETYATKNGIVVQYSELPVANKHILPVISSACKYTSNCESATWDNNSYLYACIGNGTIHEGFALTASVFCYVSKDFNGEWVKVQAEGTTLSNGLSYYNLEKKGEWQKISISPITSEGRVPVYLYFSKNNSTDFSKLEGFVIFAYPQYQITKKN